MVRRKPISISDRLSAIFDRTQTPPPDVMGVVSLQQGLSEYIDRLRLKAAREALDKYNAEDFTKPIVSAPNATYVAPVIPTDGVDRIKNKRVIKGSSTPVKSYSGRKADFTTDIYNSYYKNLVAGGSSPNDAKRQATYLTQKTVHETGYGQHIYAQHNYGGHEVPDGKGGVRRLKFNSMDDYTKADIALLDRKWKPWRKAKSEDEFVNSITTDYGSGKYNAVDPNYRDKIKGTSKRVNSYINMGRGRLRYGGVERPKAWLGAVIGAGASIFGSLLGANAQKKQLEEQRRIQEQQNAITRAENITQSLNLTQDAQREYENRFRIGYRNGGRRRLRDGVKITDGGYGIPIGQNTFLLRGGSHDDINETGQTGIGINIGGKEIEAEGGEVVQKTPNELRVFSDTITLPNGLTPAEAVEYGANKNDVFKIQQSMNGNYGRRTMRNGGCLTRPVGRNKFVTGGTLQYVNGMWQKRVNYPNSSNGYWQIIDNDEADKLRNSGWTVNGSPSINRNTTPRNSAVRNNVNKPTRTSNPTRSSSSYIYGQARGNNAAPYDAIQIGATAPKLNGVDVSTPSIDAAFYTPSRSSNTTTSSPSTTRSSGRRHLRNSGRTNIGAFNVPDISNPDSAPVTSPLQLLSDDDKSRLSAMYSEAPTVDTSILSNGVTPKQSVGEGLTTTPSNTINPGNTTTPFQRYNTSDWIGLGADVIGSLGSALINYNAASNIAEPPAPVSVSPAKLITNWNIAPRLSLINNTRNRMLRDSDEAISSAARLNRRNQINLLTNNQADLLYGEKTNKETELLNQDALNQQQVNASNVENYNRYLNDLIATRNRRGIGRAQALQFGLSGLSDAVGNFLDQGRQNYADDQAMKYYAALLGDEGRNWLRRSGVNFRNGGRMRLRNM